MKLVMKQSRSYLMCSVTNCTNILHQLSDQPSVNQVGEISHAIKSSAASFGADELAAMAQECESRVKQGQDEWMTNHLPEFRQMVQGMAKEYKALAADDQFIDRIL